MQYILSRHSFGVLFLCGAVQCLQRFCGAVQCAVKTLAVRCGRSAVKECLQRF